MAEPFLKPAERKRVTEVLSRCSSCRDIADQLERLGIDQSERKRRIESRENMARGMIEVDNVSQRSQDQ